jgi:hypothetical protein
MPHARRGKRSQRAQELGAPRSSGPNGPASPTGPAGPTDPPPGGESRRRDRSTPAPAPRPTGRLTWRITVGLLCVQALAAIALLAVLGYADLTEPAASARGALLVTGYSAVMAAAFAGCAWGALRRRPWVRGPALVLQLLLLPIGWTMVSTGLGWLGVPVMLLAGCAAAALIAPSTRDRLAAAG